MWSPSAKWVWVQELQEFKICFQKIAVFWWFFASQGRQYSVYADKGEIWNRREEYFKTWVAIRNPQK